MKAIKHTLWILTTLWLTACGNTMQSAQSGSEMHSSAESSLGQLQTADATPVENAPDMVELKYALKIPYGRALKAVSQAVKKINPLLKKQLGLENQNYFPGETPIGSALNSDWKQLTVLDIPTQQTVQSGYTITLDGFQLPLWLSRSPRQGRYTENCLDTKKTENMMSSTTFGQDISFRWIPKDSSVKMEMCMNLPGGTLTIPQRNLHVQAKKKTWYGHFSTSTGLDVQPGQIQWEYGRGCFAVNYLYTGKNTPGVLTFSATEKPYLKSVQYTGLKIRIQNWFLRLIDNILSIFKASIKKAVIQKVTSTVNNYADQDIESGKWFSQVYTDQVLNSLAQKVQTRAQKTLRRVGGYIDSTDLRTLFRDNCRLMKYSRSPHWTAKHQVFCDTVADTLRISINPMYNDPNSDQKGCYNYFANVHSANDATEKWWLKKCFFSIGFNIQVSREAQNYIEELHDVLKNQIDELRIPDRWKQTLEKYQIDENTLNQALELAEKKNLPNISDEQIQGLVSELNQNISENLK